MCKQFYIKRHMLDMKVIWELYELCIENEKAVNIIDKYFLKIEELNDEYYDEKD